MHWMVDNISRSQYTMRLSGYLHISVQKTEIKYKEKKRKKKKKKKQRNEKYHYLEKKDTLSQAQGFDSRLPVLSYLLSLQQVPSILTYFFGTDVLLFDLL